MRLLKLNNSGLSHPIARTHKDKNGNLVFNIRHGHNIYPCKQTIIGLNKKYYKPKGKEDELVMTSSDYMLSPITYKEGQRDLVGYKTNSIGQKLYFISKDDREIFNKDILLFWDSSESNLDNVKVSFSGDISNIANCDYSIYKNNKFIVFPSPILHIYGDCVLNVTGTSISGAVTKNYKRTIKFTMSTDKWDIGELINY